MDAGPIEQHGYHHIHFTLGPGDVDLTAFRIAGFRFGVENTFLVDCRDTRTALWEAMRDKTRNLVRRAAEKLTVREETDAAAFAAFYVENLEGATCAFDPGVIEPLYRALSAHGQGKLMAAYDGAGRKHAEIQIVWDEERCYFHLSTRDRRIADLGAVSLLVWTAIEEAQRRNLVLDLDGFTSASQFQFLVGFGGAVAMRLMVQRESGLFALASRARRWRTRVANPLGVAKTDSQAAPATLAYEPLEPTGRP